MDPTQLDPRALAGPVAAIAAAGAGVTIITEAIKPHVNTDRIPPPLIAAVIAAVFVCAFRVSQADPVTRLDAFPLLMTWVGLFQVAIGVYHGAKIAASAGAGDATEARIKAIHAAYGKMLEMKDRQLADQRQMVQVVPMPVPSAGAEAPPPPAPDTNFFADRPAA